jgi:hypothetical protein
MENMRFLRQCTVLQAEALFITIQIENIMPLKERNEQGCYNA